MAQLINCEFKIKIIIIISANMVESSEENIKTVESISVLHKIAACENNLNNVE